MPTPITTVDDYAAILKRSKLVPESDVDVLHSRFTRETGHGEGVEGFRKFLIGQHMLTEYQAALLQRGRAEGFFLGGYVILDRVGKGSSGSVYKAVHSSGQVVALKVLPKSKTKQADEIVARFQREGRLLTQLDHPNVVRAFQMKQSGSLHFIVMEFLDGITLAEWLGKYKKMSVADAVRMTCQILNGLQHLHDNSMIHRDLKPGNVMVCWPPNPASRSQTKDATAKILDIGIGRAVVDFNSSATHDLPLTQEGSLLGTPDYLAPEQARDARSVTIAADIYSAGCVLYHLLAGRPPFKANNAMEMMMMHYSDFPEPLADVAKGVPKELQAIFDKMTAKKPADRYTEPKQAADALTRLLPSETPATKATPAVEQYKEWIEAERPTAAPAKPAPAAYPAPSPPTYTPPSYTPQPIHVPPPVAPIQAPAAAPMPEINVELLTANPDAEERDDDRTLLELNRRDYIMIATGSAGFLIAVGFGVGLAALLRSL